MTGAPRHFDDIAGLVLAGGKSLRFGGKAKAFQLLAGEPLIAHALRPLKPLSRIAINANQGAQDPSSLALTIIADRVADAGPLGGIHAGLVWASSLVPKADWLATVPVDTPFLPDDFIERLANARNGSAVMVAATKEDFSPVCALWRTDQLPGLAAALQRGLRKMTDYLELVQWRKVDVSEDAIDSLFNINTAESLTEAERLMTQLRQNRGKPSKR